MAYLNLRKEKQREREGEREGEGDKERKRKEGYTTDKREGRKEKSSINKNKGACTHIEKICTKPVHVKFITLKPHP